MQFTRKIAIPAIAAAAILAGSGGIAYASTGNHPTPEPSDSIIDTPTPTPTLPTVLPNRCYRATDNETLVAPGHRTVRETVPAIVCITRNGTPVVFIDSNGTPVPTPTSFGPRR